MLPVQRHREIIEQMGRINNRIAHIKEVEQAMIVCIVRVYSLYSSVAKKIYNDMTAFEEKIIKVSFYSTEQSGYILSVAKSYREFSNNLQRNSKISLLSLQRTRQEQIVQQEEKLKEKYHVFLDEFQKHASEEGKFNLAYQKYNVACSKLDEIIFKFQSYSDPLQFYNQSVTNQYLQQLENKFNDCSFGETALLTDLQVLDQQRKMLSEHVKEVNQCYVFLLHNHLAVVAATIGHVIDSSKNGEVLKKKPTLNSEEPQLGDMNTFALQRLNRLYEEPDDVFADFSDLFHKSVHPNQINSDYRFFYDRCDNIRAKKGKCVEEIISLQQALLQELIMQKRNYASFETEFRNVEKQIYGNNGVESYRKKFRKYFGPNLFEAQELCSEVVRRPRNSLEKINKSLDSREHRLKTAIVDKKEALRNFEKRAKAILADHQKIKEKVEGWGQVDGDVFQEFKSSVNSSFHEFKKVFTEMEAAEKQLDRKFFEEIKEHFDAIIKEAVNHSPSKLIEKEKNRVNILKSLNIDAEIILILKEDTRYQMLLNECPKPTLYATFSSCIKKAQYENTRRVLQKKQNRMKGMFKQSQGCCGLKAEPIRHPVLAKHECKLITSSKISGHLNILSVGLTFEQWTYNPFTNPLQIMLPQSDIKSFDTRIFENQGEIIEIVTEMGPIMFASSNNSEIMQSIDKNLTFKTKDYSGSDKDKKEKRSSDSSSFIKQSSELRLVYDKTVLSSQKLGGKSKSSNNEHLLVELAKRWKNEIYFSEHFIPVLKNLPNKSNSRSDFSYADGHNKFYLKQRKEAKLLSPNVLSLTYEWKVSFPESPMLHSFKHHEQIRIDIKSKELAKMTITEERPSDEQLFIKNKFYREIDDMNKKLSAFVVSAVEREVELVIDLEVEESKSLDSCNIVIDDVNDRKSDTDSKFEKTGQSSFGRTSNFSKSKQGATLYSQNK